MAEQEILQQFKIIVSIPYKDFIYLKPHSKNGGITETELWTSVNRIQQLLTAINQGVYEKDTELGLSLLAALAGESVFAGSSGVAKSMVARRLKAAFKGAKAFEYLMSRFSTPDEIFGPISINRLKEFDKYERAN